MTGKLFRHRWIVSVLLIPAMLFCFIPEDSEAEERRAGGSWVSEESGDMKNPETGEAQPVGAGPNGKDPDEDNSGGTGQGEETPGAEADINDGPAASDPEAYSEEEAEGIEPIEMNGPMVDGEEVHSTSDPVAIAEHIDEHWETGTYHESGSDYQLQRIIVRTEGDIHDSFGAEDAIHYNTTDEYILEYDSNKSTEVAYEELLNEYGEDQVMLDTLITIDSLSIKSSDECVCWGSHITGLNSLKEKSLEEHERIGLKSGVTVAILDTGINAAHEMFDGRPIHEDSKSFIPSASPFKDDHGHGSHVAGIIADATCNHAEFLILKVMDAKGQGGMYNVVKAIDYAVERGAKVINLSIGVDGIVPGSPSHNMMEQSLQTAKENDIVVVTAAGNGQGSSGKDIDAAMSYPAYSPHTITVGAFDHELHRAGFSYYGKALDFSAPGKSVKSAWKGGSDSYKTSSGTSMAAPEIAAAAAMIDLYHPGYTADEIYEVLVEHSVDLGEEGKDVYYGYGYVNIPTPESTAIMETQVGGFTIGVETTSQKLEPVSIKHIRRGKGRFRVVWTKEKHVSGYQLRYSTKKTMSGAKTITIHGAKKTKLMVKNLRSHKKYYVQVRAYKKEGGKIHHSKWSGIKKVVTK